MFYLKEFFKSLSESWIRGASFLVLSSLLAFSLSHRSMISEAIKKISPEKLVNPYFIAVLDGTVDIEKFRHHFSKLPGVLVVDDKESERSQSKLSQLVDQLGPDYKLSSEMINLKSLRIILNPQLSRESFDFIKDQVKKMIGEKHVTTTEIKYPEVTKVLNAHPFYHFLTTSGDWGVIGILALFWIINFWLCYDIFRSRGYIVEKFQRRKLVAAKSIASGLGLIFFLFSVLAIWNGTFKTFDLVILFMIFSVFWTFSMQEWKWKPTL